jgi:hypothetical protein
MRTDPTRELPLPRILVLTLMALALTACGGGGGGDDNGGGGPPPAANGAPTAGTTSFNVDRDTDLAGTLTATDPENDALTFAKTGDPAHGQVVAFQANGTFTYRPAANYAGPDSFTITVSDPTHQVAATVNITVVAANRAPNAANDAVSVTGTTPLIDVLVNDTDPDGDALTITITEAPTAGTASIVNGRVQLTLPGGFKGVTRFKYRAADAAGLGATATAAVFVDVDRIRLVYQTNEENLAQNLYVDDVAGPTRVSAFTPTTATFLGRSNVSANGRTIVWEEATGDSNVSSPGYHAQSIWTIPADLSSAARQISAPLQAGEELSVRSPLSADGKWIVYGVTNGGGVETLYLANLLPGGTAVPIPLPAGALRIESVSQSILFGPASQYVYFTATMDLGNPTIGQAAYRIPVTDVTAAVQLSAPAVAGRETAVRLVSNDESRVVQVSANAGVASIERIDALAPGTETVLSHALVAGETLVGVEANKLLTHVAYIVDTGAAYDLYYAVTATANSGTLVDTIPSLATPLPVINQVSDNANAALISTRDLISGTPVDQLYEIPLTAAATPVGVALNPPGRNVYGYVDDFQSIAFTSTPGVAVAPRSNPSNAEQLFDKATAFYEFSADNELFAAITDLTDSSPLHLFLVNRSGASAPLQITGVANPASTTLSVRVVPVN